MASVFDQMNGGAMPGYVDPNTADPHTMSVSTGNAGDANKVLRVAWVIIIVSLVALWLLGMTFK